MLDTDSLPRLWERQTHKLLHASRQCIAAASGQHRMRCRYQARVLTVEEGGDLCGVANAMWVCCICWPDKGEGVGVVVSQNDAVRLSGGEVHPCLASSA